MESNIISMHAISNNTYLKAYTKHIQMGVFGLADQNFKITIINMPQNLEDKMDKRMKNINNFNRRWETKENLEFKKKSSNGLTTDWTQQKNR